MPQDILRHIFQHLLHSSQPKSILRLRAVNKFFYQLIEEYSKPWLLENQQRLVKNFHLDQVVIDENILLYEETKRACLLRDYSFWVKSKTKKRKHEAFPHPGIGYGAFLREPKRDLSASVLHYYFNGQLPKAITELLAAFSLENVAIRRESILFKPNASTNSHKRVREMLQFAVSAHAFEVLQALCARIQEKHARHIHLDRVNDQIYTNATNYTPTQMRLLLSSIPIRLDSLIGYEIIALRGGQSDRFCYRPLLHHVASHGNVALVKYLVAHGADITQTDEEGKTLSDMIKSRLKYASQAEISPRIYHTLANSVSIIVGKSR